MTIHEMTIIARFRINCRAFIFIIIPIGHLWACIELILVMRVARACISRY